MTNFLDKLSELSKNLKLPTLTLITIVFYSGISLVSESKIFVSAPGISGSILLCLGGFMAIMSFADYRYKEQSEHVFEQQSKAIDNLSKTLRNTSDTNRSIQKNTQAELKGNIGKISRGQYTPEVPEETSTDEESI